MDSEHSLPMLMLEQRSIGSLPHRHALFVAVSVSLKEWDRWLLSRSRGVAYVSSHAPQVQPEIRFKAVQSQRGPDRFQPVCRDYNPQFLWFGYRDFWGSILRCRHFGGRHGVPPLAPAGAGEALCGQKRPDVLAFLQQQHCFSLVKGLNQGRPAVLFPAQVFEKGQAVKGNQGPFQGTRS